MWNDLISDNFLLSLVLTYLAVLLTLTLVNMTKNSAENSVAERRLRPIYDWLDNGNNKKALQEAEKVLKKQPEFQCCRVLKCLALIRLGKEGEAESILNKVVSEVPVDEGALQAMTIAWRELQQPEKISLMYEGAVKKEPKNEEFLSHLFMSYVRLGEYKKQQMVAMNLYKVAHKNPYYFWSVMSLVLQALDGDEKLGKTVHLPLALKYLQKMEKDCKIEQEQEILLYCLILELLEKWEDGLKLLEGSLGQKLAKSGSYKTFYTSKTIEWKRKCGGWKEVAELSRSELERLPDQWSAWLDFITASRHLSQLSEVEEFIKSAQSSHPELRGPWLAELELRSQQGRTEPLPELIKSYFSKFHTKLVTYSDITKYLSALDGDTQRRIHRELSTEFPSSDISSLGDICRDIILAQLDRFCGNHEQLGEEEKQAVVVRLVKRYEAVQHLVTDMVSTDIRPSDEYVVLASHLLWSAWLETGRERYLQENLALLSWAITSSPANWQLKLMLTRVLTSVGAAGAAHTVYVGLDIKHLMLDSLGWVMDHHLNLTGLSSLASQLQSQTVKLYTQVSKDTADHIITAYRTGTFYQIRDIYNLRQRILSSYNLLSVETERQLSLLTSTSSHAQTLDMISYLEPLADKDEDSWARKRDNRDLETMVSWDPPHCRLEEVKEKSLEAELLYGRARQLIVKSVQAAVLASQHQSDCKLLTSFLSKLRSHWTLCQEKSDYKPLVWLPQSPSYPEMEAYKKSDQVPAVLRVLDITLALLEGPEDAEAVKDRMTEVADALNSAVARVAGEISACSGESLRRRELLRDTVWVLESLALTTAMAGLIFSVMKGGSDGAGKGGKKNKKGKGFVQQYLDFTDSYSKLIEALENVRKSLAESIKVFEGNISLNSMISSFEDIKMQYDESVSKEAKNIAEKIEQSYKDSFSQIKDAVQHKAQYLESIRL